MVLDRRAIPEAAVESEWCAPDGYEIRRIDWRTSDVRGAPPGSILFLPGRGDAYEKYLELLDHWAKLGWRVTALDWRGQAGSGRLGNDAFTGHIGDFAQWIDDLAAFWREWQADTPGTHVLAAHSMGGHLALRATAEGRVRPDALVLSAPMLGFATSMIPQPVLHLVARLMVSIGDSRRPAWKWGEKPGETPEHRIALLTHDTERYEDELWWREHRPELAMGPGSWRWVERAFASMRALERPGVLEQVQIPVFVVYTSADGLVSSRAIENACRRLPDCETMRFGEEARHEILREADPVRNRAFQAIDRFLERAAARKDESA